MGCCEALGNSPSTPGGDVSIVNVGGQAELYRTGTGPNPFEIRTLYSPSNSIAVLQETNTIRLETNYTVINEGTGADVYDTTLSTINVTRLRRIRAGANVTVTQNATDITIAATVPAASTCANVGSGADAYVSGSSAPFNFRRINSADARLTVTQNANDITIANNMTVANEGGGVGIYDGVNSTLANKLLKSLTSTDSSIAITDNATTINLANAVAVANEGGGAQVYDTTTSTAILKNLRSITSTGGTVTVTQNATTINLEVPASVFETYFSETSDIGTTNGTAYVVIATMGAVTGGGIGEVWTFVCTTMICHPSGLSTVNTRINWQIETATNVWADLETDINTNEPQTIAAGQRSSPRARTYNATLAMANPRLRLRMSMSAAVATGGQVEYPKCSGYRRS